MKPSLRTLICVLWGISFLSPPSSAADEDRKKLLELARKTRALIVDEKSDYAKQVKAIYDRVWSAAVDVLEAELKGEAAKGIDFAALRKNPPPLDILSTGHPIAHYQVGLDGSKPPKVIPGKGRVAISSGFIELGGNQADILAGVFAHEFVHGFQKEGQLTLRMTAEQMADRLSVPVVAKAGYNPMGVVHLESLLQMRDARRRQRQIVWSEGDEVKAVEQLLDEHNVSHVRKLLVEEELARRGLPRTPLDVSKRLNPALDRYGKEKKAVREGWKEVDKFLDGLSADKRFFEDSRLRQRFMEKILDVTASDSVLGKERTLFYTGTYQELFRIFERVLEEQVRNRGHLELFHELVSTVSGSLGTDAHVFAGYHKEFGGALSHDIPFATEVGLHGQGYLSGRTHDSLTFDESMERLLHRSFEKFLAVETTPARTQGTSVATPFRRRSEYVAFLDDYWRGTRAQLLVTPGRKGTDGGISISGTGKFRSASAPHLMRVHPASSSVKFPLDTIIQSSLKDLEKAPPAHAAAYLEEMQRIASTSLLIAASVGPRESSFQEIMDPVAFQALWDRSMPRERTDLMRRLILQFERLNPSADQQRRFSRALLAASAPHVMDPVLVNLLGNIRNGTLLDLSGALDGIRNAISWDAPAEDLAPLEDASTLLGKKLLSPRLSAKAKIKALEDAVTQKPRLKPLLDSALIPEVLRMLDEVEQLCLAVARGETEARRESYPFLFQVWLHPDVKRMRLDQLPATLSRHLEANGVKLPGAIPVREWKRSDLDTPAMTVRDAGNSGLALPDHDVVRAFYARERSIRAGREQLRILEHFIRGELVNPPGGAEVRFDDLTNMGKEVGFLEAKYVGGELGGADFIYPDIRKGKLRKYSSKERSDLIDQMVFTALDYYADMAVFSGARYEITQAEEIAPEMRKILLLKELPAKIKAAKSQSEILSLLNRHLIQWDIIARNKASMGTQSLLLDHPELSENVFFRRGIEEIQKLALDRLTREFGFERLSFLEKVELLLNLAPHANGTFYLDQQLHRLFDAASDAQMNAFMAEPDRAKRLTDRLFHPSQRILVVAHAMRGLGGTEERAKFAAKAIPKREGYLEAWNHFLGDGSSPKFPQRGLDKAGYEIVRAHEPSTEKDTKGRATGAEEFFARLQHGTDVVLMRASDVTVVDLGWYLTQGEKAPMSPEAQKEIRSLLAPLLGKSELSYKVETELLRMFQGMDAEQRLGFIYGLLVRHPTALDSKAFREKFKDTPLFSKERADAVNDIKKIVWDAMTFNERAMVASLLLNEGHTKGTLADNDEMILRNLEAMGVAGRKLAQLLKTHGHFLRPSLREKLGRFRDDNVHSNRLQIIAELERIFKADFGKDFWSEVKEVKAILGAGSMKTAVHVVMKDGREAVMKIVDPIIAGRAMRNLQLAQESVAAWAHDPDKKSADKGIVTYLMRRLRDAVEKELDLAREYENTRRHAENMEARGGRQGPKHTTPVTCIGEFCSSSINTVEFLRHRGNANRTEATKKESEHIINEILAQAIHDQFVHGDLQNRANLLLLEDGKKPAFIDLSLSHPIEEADVLLMLRAVQRLPDAAQELAGIRDGLKNGESFSALKRRLSENGRKTLEEMENIFAHAVEPLPGESTRSMEEVISSLFRELVATHQANGRIDIGDIIMGMEKQGLVFKDRYMFLLEVFALAMAEQERISGDAKAAAEELGKKVKGQLSLLQKTALGFKSTGALIQDCVAAAAKLGR